MLLIRYKFDIFSLLLKELIYIVLRQVAKKGYSLKIPYVLFSKFFAFFGGGDGVQM